MYMFYVHVYIIIYVQVHNRNCIHFLFCFCFLLLFVQQYIVSLSLHNNYFKKSIGYNLSISVKYSNI